MTRPAGFWIRFLAAVIDTFVFFVIHFILNFIVEIMHLTSQGDKVILQEKIASLTVEGTAFADTLYDIMMINGAFGVAITLFNLSLPTIITIYLTRTKGGSPGKIALDLKVVDIKTNEKLNYGQAILREVLGKMVLVPATLGLGYATIPFTRNKRGLHDLVAKSMVTRND